MHSASVPRPSHITHSLTDAEMVRARRLDEEDAGASLSRGTVRSIVICADDDDAAAAAFSRATRSHGDGLRPFLHPTPAADRALLKYSLYYYIGLRDPVMFDGPRGNGRYTCSCCAPCQLHSPAARRNSTSGCVGRCEFTTTENVKGVCDWPLSAVTIRPTSMTD